MDETALLTAIVVAENPLPFSEGESSVPLVTSKVQDRQSGGTMAFDPSKNLDTTLPFTQLDNDELVLGGVTIEQYAGCCRELAASPKESHPTVWSRYGFRDRQAFHAADQQWMSALRSDPELRAKWQAVYDAHDQGHT